MPQTITSILNSLRVLVQALRAGSRASEQKLGMTGAQLFVLEKLSEAEQLTVNELAERTHTHQSTVSVVVSKLVDKGLVARARSEKDARVQLLSITAEGLARLGESAGTVQDRLLRAIRQLPAGEQRELARLLEQVIGSAGLADMKPQLFLEDEKEKAKGKMPA